MDDRAVSVLDLKQKRRRAERGEVGGKDGRKKENLFRDDRPSKDGQVCLEC